MIRRQLGVDLTHIPKRLGDGFYEQQLVRNEVTALTGKAVLGPYADLQTMYQSLMAAGADLSKSLDLPIGASLSADQVSKLTSNVIMMETRVVDGQSVLVPVVYLALANQQNVNGPLISATNIDLQNAQSFTNSGTIKADNTLAIQGKQIDNAFGALQSGGLMSLKTENNIDLTSASVKAGSLQLDAGKDLILDTATKTNTRVSRDGATSVVTTLGPTAKLDVVGNASIVTGGNFQQNAGNLSVGGNLGMNVGGNWDLGAVQTVAQQRADELNANWGPSGTYRQVLTALSVAAGGNVTGGLGQFAQNATVAYLQELGANQVKQIADNLGSEEARAALHAIVGCAGAAAGSQSCGAGAMGAATSSVLGSLLAPSTNLSASEREARDNLVTSLVAGVAAVSGQNVATATGAGKIEMENNQISPMAPAPGWLAGFKLPGYKGETSGKGDGVIADPATAFDPTIKPTGSLIYPMPDVKTVGDWITAIIPDQAKGLVDYITTAVKGGDTPVIDAGKQGKHQPDHNNFIPGRSELSYPDPQKLVDDYAGTGQPANNVAPGQPGYRERVNFGKVIGNYVDPVTGEKMPTTNGIIHYSKDGVHIVPGRP